MMVRVGLLLFHLVLCGALRAQANVCGINWRAIDKLEHSEPSIHSLDSIKANCKLNDHEILHWLHIRGKQCITLSRYDEALEHFQEGIQRSMDLKPDTFQAIFSNQMGVVKYYLGQKEDAISWFNKAEKIAVRNKLFKLQAFCLNNAGGIYTELQQYEAAERSLLGALAIYKKMGKNYRPKYLHTYRILATMYENTGQRQRAEAMYIELLEEAKALKDTTTIATTTMYLSYNEALLKNKERALLHAKEALDLLSLDSGNLNAIETGLNNWSQVNAMLGNYDIAYQALRQADRLNRSIYSNELNSKVAEMEVAFNTENERQQKELAQTKAKAAEIKLTAAKREFNSLALISILIVLILGSVFVIYRQRQRSKLSEKDIQVQKGRIAALLEGEERERTRIARDLHDGVSQMLFALKLNFSATNISDPQSHELIDKSIAEVRTISHNLLPKKLGENGLVDAIAVLVDQLNNLSTNFKADFSCSITEMHLKQEQQINLYRIIQELINNTIKHSKATQLGLNLSENARELILQFNDNGVGLNPSAIKDAGGIGWKNIMARLELLSGNLELIPVESGTHLTFTIPKEL